MLNIMLSLTLSLFSGIRRSRTLFNSLKQFDHDYEKGLSYKPFSVSIVEEWTVISLTTIVTITLWLSGRAWDCQIRRSDVQFLVETWNFFFVSHSKTLFFWTCWIKLKQCLQQRLPTFFGVVENLANSNGLKYSQVRETEKLAMQIQKWS